MAISTKQTLAQPYLSPPHGVEEKLGCRQPAVKAVGHEPLRRWKQAVRLEMRQRSERNKNRRRENKKYTFPA